MILQIVVRRLWGVFKIKATATYFSQIIPMQSNVINFNELITHCIAMGYALFFMNMKMAQGKQVRPIISNPFPWYLTQSDHIIAGGNIVDKIHLGFL